MAPIAPRKSVAKDRFPATFASLKVQNYLDPAARGPGSHTIRSIAWNPTGTLIATGSADRTLRVWNPDKPKVTNSTELRGHTGGIVAVGWNPIKEAELTSVSSDGTCKFWDVRSKNCTATVSLGGEGWTLCWAADGSVIMVGRKDDTLVQIVTDPTPTAEEKFPQSIQTNEMRFNWSRPPTHLFLTRVDGTVSINSYPAMRTIHTLNAHTSSCMSIAFSPNARYLAIGASDALISLWDTTDWACQRTVDSSVGMVKSVSFSFDGSFVVGADDEGTSLEVVHVESGDAMGKVECPQGANVVAWHPSRYWIAWAGEGGGLRIVGAAGGQL